MRRRSVSTADCRGDPPPLRGKGRCRAGTALRIAVVTDEEYVTLGVRFRTPCPPDMAAAIGRVIYNFLSLEGQVAALLVDAHEVDAHEARTLMAGKKESRLLCAAKRYDRKGDTFVAQALRDAAAAFRAATQDEWNALGHARLFTANRTVEGGVAPGLAMTDGTRSEMLATKPEEILAMASRIEETRPSIADARRAVRAASP